MQEGNKSSVWIIGAGFSRHAGGPLMNELFNCKFNEDFENESASDREKLQLVAYIYRLYGPKEYRRSNETSSLVLWNNPEQFLEMLETDYPVSYGTSNRFPISQVRPFAHRRLCHEVNHYIKSISNQPNCDRLAPYRYWISKIGKQDTIVSFNYDTLVEKTADIEGVFVYTPLPKHTPTKGKLNLLKLHGSVDWNEDGKRIEDEKDTSPRFIATPGAAKGTRTTSLCNHWQFASEAIANAECVYILGYRFPESDSIALMRLLHPMRENKSIHVKVVLGIHTESPEVTRLKRLLEYHIGKREGLEVIPLYSQDYLISDRSWFKRKVWSPIKTI
jgi:hypothetical protein